MSDEAKTPDVRPTKKARFEESPNIAQTHVVNNAFGFGLKGSLFDIVLTTNEMRPDADGQLAACNVIVARLRFDLEFAKALRAQLDRGIAAVSTPPKDHVN